MFKKILFSAVALGMMFSNSAAYALPQGGNLTPRQALYNYAKTGNVSALQAMKKQGFSIDLADEKGNSALCEATWRKDKNAVASLISAGANTNAACMQKIPASYKQAVGFKNVGQVASQSSMPAQKVGASSAAGAGEIGLSTGAMVGIGVGTAAVIGGGIALVVNNEGSSSHKNNSQETIYCNDHGIISSITGKCLCTDGYSGENCEIAPNLTNACTPVSCGQHGLCETETGTCLCRDGYSGTNCEIAPTSSCTTTGCSGHGTCNSETGVCVCVTGWTGALCEKALSGEVLSSFCAENMYGTAPDNCVACPAHSTSLLGTQTIAGCFCDTGYVKQGDQCVPQLTCGANAHQENGTCVCNAGYEGDPLIACGTIELTCGAHQFQRNGKCVCEDGYIKDNNGVCVEAEPTLIGETIGQTSFSQILYNDINPIVIVNDRPRNVIAIRNTASRTLTNYNRTIQITNNSHGNVYGLYQSGSDFSDNGGKIIINNVGDGNVYAMYADNAGVWDMCNGYSKDGIISISNKGDGDVYGLFSLQKTSMHNAWGRNGLLEIKNVGNGNVYGIYGIDKVYNIYNTTGTYNAVIKIENEGAGTAYGLYNPSAEGFVYNRKLAEGQHNTIDLVNKGSGKAIGIYSDGGTVYMGGFINIDNQSTGDAYGIYGGEGTTINIEPSAVINIKTTQNGGNVYGVYSGAYSTVKNEGKIIIDGSENAYGIYVGKGSTVINTGKIQINNYSYTEGNAFRNFIHFAEEGTTSNTCTAHHVLSYCPTNGVCDSCFDGADTRYRLTGCTDPENYVMSGNACYMRNKGPGCDGLAEPFDACPDHAICTSCHNNSVRAYYGIVGCEAGYVMTGTGGHTTRCEPISSFTEGETSTSKFVNAGVFDAAEAPLHMTPQMSLGKDGQFMSDVSISGTGKVDASTVQNGFDSTYVLEDAFIAPDTSNLFLQSDSAMFDASLAENGRDVVMQKKNFTDLTGNKSLAGFLEANYAAGNNENFFNQLKAIDSVAAFGSSLTDLTGQNTIARFAVEDLSAMREINFTMNKAMFQNAENDRFETVGTLNGFAFKNNNASGGSYALASKKIAPNWKIGYAMSNTNLSTDDSEGTTRRNQMFNVFMPMGYERFGVRLISTPQIGFARGHYTRSGFEGGAYKGVVEKRTFALMNEARYPICFGKMTIEPAVEFNAIVYNQRGHEDKKAYALTMPSDTNVSIESGIGLYALKDTQIGYEGRLSISAGLMMYREFADPYNIKMGMDGMSGSFNLYNERSPYRAVASFGLSYDIGGANMYGSVQHFMETDTHTTAKAGIKVGF